jgi:hypothetical protein
MKVFENSSREGRKGGSKGTKGRRKKDMYSKRHIFYALPPNPPLKLQPQYPLLSLLLRQG